MSTEKQLDFFRRLCAPFEAHQVKTITKGGRTLSYITARTLMNRLDEIAGPTGWYPVYAVNEHGVTCNLHLLVPSNADSPHGEQGWHWLFKSDGGGFAGMASEEDNEKSGYSDALKRAGVAWGIGRYLYRDGVPDYLGEQEPPDPGPPAATHRPVQPAPYGGSAHRPAPPTPPARPAPVAPPRPGGGWNYDNFKPPMKPGGAAFAWLKKMEEHFGPGIVDHAQKHAQACGYTSRATEWDADQLQHMAWDIIDWLKEWPNYQGEFDHLEDPRANFR